jgi:8-oxo-dGTP pyrophosphatase MutT (NUDIX family)
MGPARPAGERRPASLALAQIERRLAGSVPRHAREDWLVPSQTAEASRELRRYFPADPVPAAVLIPLVAHPEPTVLLTRRAQALRNHAGQVSFPGGHIEARDGGPLEAALREAREEIGLEARFVSVIGFLPDHVVISGFRVTPVVARVSPGFSLSLDEEVEEAFEVPLSFVFDPGNQRPRRHRFGGTDVEVAMVDILYGRHQIWGATAGMLMTLYRMCFAEGEPLSEQRAGEPHGSERPASAARQERTSNRADHES